MCSRDCGTYIDTGILIGPDDSNSEYLIDIKPVSLFARIVSTASDNAYGTLMQKSLPVLLEVAKKQELITRMVEQIKNGPNPNSIDSARPYVGPSENRPLFISIEQEITILMMGIYLWWASNRLQMQSN